jgi:hypothetical protein
MKTRTRACCVGGIAAIACLAILSAALASTGGVSPRDLAPDELWLIRGGGTSHVDRCCSIHSSCAMGTGSIDCPSRTSGCTITPWYRWHPPTMGQSTWLWCDKQHGTHVPNGHCDNTQGTYRVCMEEWACVWQGASCVTGRMTSSFWWNDKCTDRKRTFGGPCPP